MKARFYSLLIVVFLATFDKIVIGQDDLPLEFSTKKRVKRHNSRFLPIYNFQENDKVASIGVGSGVKEVMYTIESPKVYFYLQEINPYFLRSKYIKIYTYQLEEMFGKKIQSEFKLFIGDSISTNLPNVIFDKILIEHALHEFTHPKEMLADIVSKLSKDGSLFILEYITNTPGIIHEGCRGKVYQEEELLTLLDKFQCKLEGKYQLPSLFNNMFIFKFKKY